MEENLAELALRVATNAGAQYADVRVEFHEAEIVRVRNGTPFGVSRKRSIGLGVRVLYDGSWGFAATSVLGDSAVIRAAERALCLAKASGLARDRKVSLVPVKPWEANLKSPFKVDPFSVKLQSKLALLLDADRLMKVDDSIKVREGFIACNRRRKLFLNTDGTRVSEEVVSTGAGIRATAEGNGDVQSRSYPGNSDGNWAQAGYEFVESLDLVGHAEQIAEEAVALLSAEVCPNCLTDVIIGSAQLALQIHESCGHAVELDRVLGYEQSYAGSSFLTLDKLNSFAFGSNVVNITADASLSGGPGSLACDDEGVKAQKVKLVQNGIFCGYLTSRETAAAVGLAPTGSVRAESWNRLPLIRMTNVNLEPGDWDLKELIRDTKDGIYLDSNCSWSIDDKRWNFRFGTEVAWEIKDGSLGKMLKHAGYAGITPEFWRSCDAVTSKDYWQVWGLSNCAKGEPVQLVHVGHGASPARFRGVRVLAY